MSDKNAHLVEEVLISFGIRVDPWTMEYKDAVDKVRRSLEESYSDGYEVGFDEGESEGSQTAYQDAYDDGVETGLEQADLLQAVENLLSTQNHSMILSVDRIVVEDDDSVVVHYISSKLGERLPQARYAEYASASDLIQALL